MADGRDEREKDNAMIERAMSKRFGAGGSSAQGRIPKADDLDKII